MQREKNTERDDIVRNMIRRDNRDKLTHWFLYHDFNSLTTFNLSNLLNEELDEMSEIVLGTDDVKKSTLYTLTFEDSRDYEMYLKNKKDSFKDVYFRYSRIFNFCNALGITNLYDIGCATINQSFLLFNYSDVFYTGIESGRFILNDYRETDLTYNNIFYPVTEQAPPPFCGGRISFIKGHYPFELNVTPNNIAIASASFNAGSKEFITTISRDFERVLFTVRKSYYDDCSKANWQGMELYPIGRDGFIDGMFVFGTKHREDIELLKTMYPLSNGRFLTGIFNFGTPVIPGSDILL